MEVTVLPEHINTGIIDNPYPGLRPFGLEESHLFFGREGQSEEVLENLSDNKFVAVIGASGSGKSSLLYCGVVPILYGGFVTDAGSKWNIITTRPGNNPIHNLAMAICESVKEEENINIIESVLRRNSFGIEEAIDQIKSEEKENYLLIIDQFEELFRFKSSRNQKALNDSEGYVKLLIQAVKQSKIPIYVVLTMRSDFIGDCSQFTGLTALINQSNYLVPQMTRNDMEKAIEGPVAVGGASIEKQLVQELLNEIGDNPDQLPIIQHALMRTWNYWKRNSDRSNPLSLNDYETIGKMEKALSNHANEAYDELSENQKILCESIFKALTQKGSDNRGVRRPTKVSLLAEIANCTIEEAIEIINVFRKEGRSFLTPSFEIKLEGNSVIDISHESLMRIWERLKIWVDDEANSVQLYLRLSEASEMFHLGKTGLWRPPDLDLANNWKEKHKPTLAWAERHNPAFERSMVFLDSSTEAYKDEEENKIRLQKRQLKRTRNFSIILGVAFILSLVAVVIALDQKNNADKQTRAAETQRLLAEDNQKEAEKQAAEAKKQKDIAENALDEAQTQKQRAENEMQVSEKERKRAEQNEEEALIQSQKASKNYQEAQRQSKIAQEKSEEAYRRNILAISQSMAVKSLQIDNDVNLQALLAYQSFLFNKRYKGLENHPDVYAGLYNAWKKLNGNKNNALNGHDDAIKSLLFEPKSNNVISAGADGKIIKWNLTNNSNSTITTNETINQALDISNDGKWLACGTDGIGVHIYDINRNYELHQRLIARNNNIKAVKFSSNGKYLYSLGLDKKIIQWNTSDWQQKVILEHDIKINCFDITNDEETIITGTEDGEIIEWKRSSGYDAKIIFKNDISIWSLSLSNDNKLLTAGDKKGNLRVIDIKNKAVIQNLRGHTARIEKIKFSPNDKFLGSVSMDGTVRLWDRENLTNLPILLNDHEGFVFSIAFSPDNNTVITGSTYEDRIIVRPTKSEIIAQKICDKIERNMTQEEWNTYIGSQIEYEETCGKKIVVEQK